MNAGDPLPPRPLRSRNFVVVASLEHDAILKATSGVRSRQAWCAAKRTHCQGGHLHASGMEANVCNRLALECAASHSRLYQQVRFPLLHIGGKERGRVHTLTVDFVVVEPCGLWHAIDAKAKGRISRDWRLRTAAFVMTYGREVKEVDR